MFCYLSGASNSFMKILLLFPSSLSHKCESCFFVLLFTFMVAGGFLGYPAVLGCLLILKSGTLKFLLEAPVPGWDSSTWALVPE